MYNQLLNIVWLVKTDLKHHISTYNSETETCVQSANEGIRRCVCGVFNLCLDKTKQYMEFEE